MYVNIVGFIQAERVTSLVGGGRQVETGLLPKLAPVSPKQLYYNNALNRTENVLISGKMTRLSLTWPKVK